jgi:hypothetical protein
MPENDDIPDEGVTTDEWLRGPARVWWQSEVMLAFPSVEDRTPILQALETTMIACRTATLYYHMEVIDGHFLRYETAEDEKFIYVNVTMGVPILIEVPEELLDEAVNLEA